MGHTIEVVQKSDPTLFKDRWGEARFEDNKIFLEETDKPCPLSIREQTFWHETVHFILHYMGENELKFNEKFVDLFAQCIYQVLSTMEE
jgi:hypothetical protein